MLPPVEPHIIEDLAFDVATKASGLASQIPLGLRRSVGDLLRTMNCYYSNQIAGFNTHPQDIERALLHNEYSTDQQLKEFQYHSVSHIKVQQLIDNQKDLQHETTSVAYLSSLHREFCQHIPEEIRIYREISSGNILPVIPGAVQADPSGDLHRFLDNYAQHYDSKKLSKVKQIAFLGYAYRDFLWARPFSVYNRRVALLMFHSSLKRCGIDDSCWSLARGLARNHNKYQELLFSANFVQLNGDIPTGPIGKFCEFFLSTCTKEIDFMGSLLDPSNLMRRMRHHIEEKEASNDLPKGSFKLLREILLAGEVSRSRAQEISCSSERSSRNSVSALVKAGYLKSETTRSPLVLAFPINAVEWLFPRMYDIEII